MRIPFRRSIEILLTEGPRTFVKELTRTGFDHVKMRLFRARYAQHRNIRIARDEWQAKALVMRAGPREMTITSTTYCNLKCVMCEHAIEGMVDRRHMDVDLVQKLATLIPTTDCFQLHGLGEPLLSPAFWTLLDEISAVHRGVPYITINSNGLLLNEKTIARILDSKLKEINISIDAATADTYEKIRGGDFFRLMANIEALVQARRAADRDDFRILLNMTLMRANVEELPGFVRLAKQVGADGIAFWHLNDGENYERPDWVVDKDPWRFAYCDESLQHYPRISNAMIREAVRVSDEIGMPIIDNHFKTRLVDEQSAGEDAPYRPTSPAVAKPAARLAPISTDGGLRIVEAGATGCATARASRSAAGTLAVLERVEETSDRPAPKSETIGLCDAPWRWLLVNERGDCSPCCYAQQPIGNLRDHSAAEIWNGPMMQEIRSSITKGEVHRACQGASCKYVMGGSQ